MTRTPDQIREEYYRSATQWALANAYWRGTRGRGQGKERARRRQWMLREAEEMARLEAELAKALEER